MKNMIEVRYFSKFGHSERMAKVVGEVTGVTPQLVSVPLQGEVDTLYLGTGVFLGKIHAEVVDFIKTLTPDKVKRVVCFGSCAIIKSPVPQMRKLLEAQGVKVETREFTCPRLYFSPVPRIMFSAAVKVSTSLKCWCIMPIL